MHGDIAHPGTASALRGQRALARAGPRPPLPLKTLMVEHSDARRVLANATGISPDCIFARTRLEDLIADSLVMEVVVIELEDFLGREADRAAVRKLETVEDLARHMLAFKA
jgi:acyl carrier protein